MIFNIQRCSIHDGQGLRTLVFFKGCPLRCKWCANPESQSYEKEIMESSIKCVGCGLCRAVCPEHAISDDGTIDRNLCTGCMQCVDVCYAESKKLTGRDYIVEELYEEIEKDKPFYARFGGGVTFSGGEPLTQGAYLKGIAKRCKEKGIHVMVESCGFGVYEEFSKALPYIDGMFLDVKHMDPDAHKDLTGVNNEKILENIKRISDFGIPVTIRTPVVPGCTDSEENIRAIADFVGKLPSAKEYELLAYHDFGTPKYKALGRSYALADVKTPDDETMRELVRSANEVLSKYGKECFWMKNNNKEVVK